MSVEQINTSSPLSPHAETLQKGKCVSCKQQLKDGEGKKLSCLHSFCATCLEGDQAKLNGNFMKSNGTYRCPIDSCNKLIALPEIGISGLTPFWSYTGAVNINQSDIFKCQLHSPNELKMVCLDCLYEQVCIHCIQRHKEHKLEDREEIINHIKKFQADSKRKADSYQKIILKEKDHLTKQIEKTYEKVSRDLEIQRKEIKDKLMSMLSDKGLVLDEIKESVSVAVFSILPSVEKDIKNSLEKAELVLKDVSRKCLEGDIGIWGRVYLQEVKGKPIPTNSRSINECQVPMNNNKENDLESNSNYEIGEGIKENKESNRQTSIHKIQTEKQHNFLQTFLKIPKESLWVIQNLYCKDGFLLVLEIKILKGVKGWSCLRKYDFSGNYLSTLINLEILIQCISSTRDGKRYYFVDATNGRLAYQEASSIGTVNLKKLKDKKVEYICLYKNDTLILLLSSNTLSCLDTKNSKELWKFKTKACLCGVSSNDERIVVGQRSPSKIIIFNAMGSISEEITCASDLTACISTDMYFITVRHSQREVAVKKGKDGRSWSFVCIGLPVSVAYWDNYIFVSSFVKDGDEELWQVEKKELATPTST